MPRDRAHPLKQATRRRHRPAHAQTGDPKAQRHFLEQLIQALPDAIAVLDRDRVYRHVNRRYAQLFGRTADEILDRSVFEVFPGTEDRLEAPLNQVLASGQPFEARRLPFTYTDASGPHEIVLDLDLRPMTDLQGAVGFVLVHAVEVSERVRLEAALTRQGEEAREHEALFASFMDNSPSASFVRDASGRIIYISPTFEHILGVRPSETLGKVQPPWVSDADWKLLAENDRKVLESDKPMTFEERIRLPSGETKIVLSMKFPFRLSDDQRFLGTTMLDLTAMKRQEDALRDSNQELERLRRLQRHEFEFMVQNVKDYAIYMLDPEGRVMTWNAGAEAISGYSEREVLGRPNTIFHPPEEVAAGTPQQMLQRALAEGSVEDDGWRVRKNGDRFCAHTAVTAVHDHGKLVGFVKVVRDMTDLRRIEEIQRDLAALAKLEHMKDDFLSVISHELRTPLNFIMGFASILDDQVAGPLNETQQTYVKKILNGADRMLFHVNNLVEMSRLSAGKLTIHPSHTLYEALVAHVLEILTPLADERALRLEADIEVCGEVMIDSQRIGQVISNLVDNAIKFTPPGGRVRVKAYPQGDVLVTEVSDTGIGLAEEDLPKLFQRFVQLDMTSTRAVGGTGLGLAICKAIVEAHGGHIGARSEGPGQGSTFWFSLPLSREDA